MTISDTYVHTCVYCTIYRTNNSLNLYTKSLLNGLECKRRERRGFFPGGGRVKIIVNKKGGVKLGERIGGCELN